MEALSYFRLDAFQAIPGKAPLLPHYLPQIRFRRALKGHLNDPIYALRAKEIVGKTHVKTATEVRKALGLKPEQYLVALLFDDDEVIELLYRFPSKVIELAKAGFDLVVSASFSIWKPRPRLHNLRNLMRSLDLCIALQRSGASAIPRLDWHIEHDVHRWAEWLEMNPSVDVIAVDAMTCATNGWDEILEGLSLLDQLTGEGLRYLINGPSVERRWADLLAVVSSDRLCLTDAGPISAPPTAQEELQFGSVFAQALGPRFNLRIHHRRSSIERITRRAA